MRDRNKEMDIAIGSKLGVDGRGEDRNRVGDNRTECLCTDQQKEKKEAKE